MQVVIVNVIVVSARYLNKIVQCPGPGMLIMQQEKLLRQLIATAK